MITGAHVLCSFHNVLNSMNSLRVWDMSQSLEVDGFCIVLVVRHNLIYAWSTQKPNLGPATYTTLLGVYSHFEAYQIYTH